MIYCKIKDIGAVLQYLGKKVTDFEIKEDGEWLKLLSINSDKESYK